MKANLPRLVCAVLFLTILAVHAGAAPAVTATKDDGVTAHGGSVTIDAASTLIFTPPVAFAGSTDMFAFTPKNSADTDPGTPPIFSSSRKSYSARL